MENEALFRDMVLSDASSDPAWYAGILLKRAASTATLAKLWPRAARDGHALSLRTSANEGSMDTYWTMVPTADHVGLGRWRVELPMLVLLLPLLVLPLLGLAVRRRGPGSRRLAIGPRLELVACLAVAALGSPVLVTTASGFEPQAFAFVYWLAFGLCADTLADLGRGTTRSRAAEPASGLSQGA